MFSLCAQTHTHVCMLMYNSHMQKHTHIYVGTYVRIYKRLIDIIFDIIYLYYLLILIDR